MGKNKQKIILVDDNVASLSMGKNILKNKYDVYPVPSGEKLFELLTKISPDLILLDITMPEMDGFEVIRRLKASRKTHEIPVIFLTSRDDPANELEGLSLGAIDYISKPFSPSLLIQRIENHLMHSDELLFNAFGVLAEAIEFRVEQFSDMINNNRNPGSKFNSTMGHGKRINAYVKLLLDELETRKLYNEAANYDQRFLLPACQLHDLGKLFISESILNKEGPLNDDEYNEVKKHPSLGINLIDKLSPEARDHIFLHYARIIVGNHHEKWDGTGYPKGLKEEEIPLLGRVMALADGYDALISAKPYRDPFNPSDAQKMIMAGKGTWLDPVLVDVFTDTTSSFTEIAGWKG